MRGRLGFGASEAKDGIMRRDGASSNEKLLEQLMGKGYANRQEKRTKGADQPGGATMPAGSKPRPAPVKRAADSASEDEGRTALGKSRQGGKHSDVQLDDEPMEDSMAKGTEPEAQGLGLRPQKKANNYLDEVLADRAQQKRKKSRKKRKRGASEQDS